jgi:two-component system OmpR family response regulator
MQPPLGDSKHAPAPHLRQPHVLVVDDEYDILDVVASILNRDGCHTIKAANGREALEAVCAEPVDVVLLDLMMPILSGLAVLRGIRRLCRRMNRPMPIVIVCSGYSQLVTRALEEGGRFSLTKPFELNQLLFILRAAMRETASG